MTHDLRFGRVIDAPPEEVFDAFTRPDGQLAFYGQDDPGWIVESECDLRVGGLWTVAFGPSFRPHRGGHDRNFRSHRFIDLEPCASTNAQRHDRYLRSPQIRTDIGDCAGHAKVVISECDHFEDHDGKTLMTMVQRGFPNVELRDEHERGLPNAFARLQRIVSRGGT